MIMVASTTLGVSTVRACYHGHRAAPQPRVDIVTRVLYSTDEIALDPLARERDHRVERVPAERLLHLTEQ